MKANKIVSLLFVVPLMFWVGSCGRKNVVQEDRRELRAPKVAAKRGEVAATGVRELFEATSLSKQLYLPAPTLLPPRALEQVYRPIFGSQPRLRAGATAFFVNNPSAYFLPQERQRLGEFHVSGPVRGTFVEGQSLILSQQGLQASYLASLRAFASDGCKGLVEADLQAPLGTGELVHAMPVQPIKINQVLGRFLRKAPSATLFKGTDGYAAALDEALRAADKEDTEAKKSALTKDAWVELCVALATDPRVFIR